MWQDIHDSEEPLYLIWKSTNAREEPLYPIWYISKYHEEHSYRIWQDMRNISTVFGQMLKNCWVSLGFSTFFILFEQFCLKKQRKTIDFHDFPIFFFGPRLSWWLEPASSQPAASLQPRGGEAASYRLWNVLW